MAGPAAGLVPDANDPKRIFGSPLRAAPSADPPPPTDCRPCVVSIRNDQLTGREALPIISRRYLQRAHEGRTHLFLAGIAASLGDHFDAIIRFLQAPAGSIQADLSLIHISEPTRPY